MHLIIRFIVNALALYLIARYVPGFNHGLTPGYAALAALIFGLVNALLGPILILITLPLTIITFGIFSIIVNYILFAITVWIAPNFHNTGEISPWLANLYGAVIMMVVSGLVRQSSRPEAERARR
jgi:putative membrane protein